MRGRAKSSAPGAEYTSTGITAEAVTQAGGGPSRRSGREVRQVLVKTSDLRLLDVINIGDGRRLGVVYDLDVDVETGEILSIILPGERGLFGFARKPDIEIPWSRVVRVGVDVILVDLPPHMVDHRFERPS